MASTLAPQRALDYAKKFVKDMNVDKLGYQILDDVNKEMWMAAPWRWTVGAMPTVTLAANTTDYTITFPGDFLYLEDAYVSDGSIPVRDLRVEALIPPSVTTQGQVSRVAQASSTVLRVAPVPASFAATGPTLISTYKKMAPVITNQNMSTTGVQVFDDEWFWVFQEGVLWRAYMYGDDQRAGSATVAKGAIQYTGQLGLFQAGLEFMRQNEILPEPPESKKRDAKD